VALGERTSLAIADVEAFERSFAAAGERAGHALTTAWRACRDGGWPRRAIDAGRFYEELLAADPALLGDLLAPPPAGVDEAARFVESAIRYCGFTPLVADWGLSDEGRGSAPFAFVRHAIETGEGGTVAPVAVCLGDDVLRQAWGPERTLGANAHLALLVLAAGDLDGMFEHLRRHDGGWTLAGRPLVSALDHMLRQLGYAVWNDLYQKDWHARAQLGGGLVELGERLGLLRPAGSGLEAVGALADALYYPAYHAGVVDRMRQALAAAPEHAAAVGV
jgi:hypothetical protein